MMRYIVRWDDGLEVGYKMFPDGQRKEALQWAEHMQLVDDAVVEVYDTVEDKFLEV